MFLDNKKGQKREREHEEEDDLQRPNKKRKLD